MGFGGEKMIIKKKNSFIFGVDLPFLEVICNEYCCRLVLCDNAENFSFLALRRLLLSSEGPKVDFSVAISFFNGEIAVRREFLKDFS